MLKSGAGNETRTRDPDLGKVVLYQLSYSRKRLPSIAEDSTVSTLGAKFFGAVRDEFPVAREAQRTWEDGRETKLGRSNEAPSPPKHRRGEHIVLPCARNLQSATATNN